MIRDRLNSYSESISHISMLIVLNMVLAVVALVKDVYLASYLGATAVGDAFLLAFFLVDAVGNNLMAGGLLVGCVPYFSKLYIEKRFNALRKGSKNIVIVVLTFMIGLSILIYLSVEGIVALVGRGLDNETIISTVSLIKLLLPMLFTYPVIAVMVAYAQVHERFKVTAIVPIAYNLTILAGIIAAVKFNLTGYRGTRVIALTITSGMAVIVFVLFIIDEMVSRKDRKIRIDIDQIEDTNGDNILTSVKKVLEATVPYMVLLILMQGMLYVERGMASRFESGSISGLNYAYRLSQFPIWVIVAAVNTVIYPKIAKKIAGDELDSAIDLINMSVWNVIVLILPITGMFFIFREPIISTLFLRDAFDSYALKVTTSIFATYCMVVIPQSVIFLSVRFHMSLMEKRKAMVFLVFGFIINLIADFALLPYFKLYTFGIGATIGGLGSAALFIHDFKTSSISNNLIVMRKVTKLILIGVSHLLLTYICFFLWNRYFSELGGIGRFISLGILLMTESILYLVVVIKSEVLQKET